MFEKFLYFIDQNKLPQKGKHLLLAVSGGIDSVVMTHLLHRAGYDCVVAHCNFQLRGGESDADEQFVKQLAAQYSYPFESVKFETSQYASENSLSIQMAARNLRYEWFYSVCEKTGCGAIATAHHANDVAETMLINLVRGTGLAGLHGIPVKNGLVVRPLLFADKVEIEKYALENQLKWREDASNLKDDYVRNKIRQHVVPVLNEINPKAVINMNRLASHVKNYELLTAGYLTGLEQTLVTEHLNGLYKSIVLDKLLSYPAPEFLLFLLIGKYGFNETVCNDILSSDRTGATFIVTRYRMVRDREELILFDEKKVFDDRVQVIDEKNTSLQLIPGLLYFNKIAMNDFENQKEPDDFRCSNVFYLDASKIQFPLSVRRWQNGDSFYPLGMNGSKLVSDFLTDAKFSVAEKELVYLLLSGNEVVWVVGSRPDNRFRITESTAEVLKCTYLIN